MAADYTASPALAIIVNDVSISVTQATPANWRPAKAITIIKFGGAQRGADGLVWPTGVQRFGSPAS